MYSLEVHYGEACGACTIDNIFEALVLAYKYSEPGVDYLALWGPDECIYSFSSPHPPSPEILPEEDPAGHYAQYE